MDISIKQMFERLSRYQKYFNKYNTWNFHYLMFDQTWPDSLCGINDGPYATCDAFMRAPTFVVFGEHNADVFFGGTYAYSCDKTNHSFVEDWEKHELSSQKVAKTKYDAFIDTEIDGMAG